MSQPCGPAFYPSSISGQRITCGLGGVQSQLQAFQGCEYVNTDLITSKGICYAKYSSAAVAEQVIEAIHASQSMVRPRPLRMHPAYAGQTGR